MSKKIKIYVVEDEVVAQMLIKQAIHNQENMEIVGMTEYGKLALKEIPKMKPDVILMDIMLKDNFTGLQVFSELNKKGFETSIIFATALPKSILKKNMSELLKDREFLSKPYSGEDIVNIINKVCNNGDNHE